MGGSRVDKEQQLLMLVQAQEEKWDEKEAQLATVVHAHKAAPPRSSSRKSMAQAHHEPQQKAPGEAEGAKSNAAHQAEDAAGPSPSAQGMTAQQARQVCCSQRRESEKGRKRGGGGGGGGGGDVGGGGAETEGRMQIRSAVAQTLKTAGVLSRDDLLAKLADHPSPAVSQVAASADSSALDEIVSDQTEIVQVDPPTSSSAHSCSQPLPPTHFLFLYLAHWLQGLHVLKNSDDVARNAGQCLVSSPVSLRPLILCPALPASCARAGSPNDLPSVLQLFRRDAVQNKSVLVETVPSSFPSPSPHAAAGKDCPRLRARPWRRQQAHKRASNAQRNVS
eukprot:766890-Hanusia_phi.AAC.6